MKCVVSSHLLYAVLYCTVLIYPRHCHLAFSFHHRSPSPHAPRAIPLSLCPHSFRFPRHRPSPPPLRRTASTFCFHSQPWSTRSPIRRNLASVHSNGFRAAPVSLTVRCSPFLAVVLYYLWYVFPLTFRSRTFHLYSCCAPPRPFPFIAPLLSVPLSSLLVSCASAPLSSGLFVCLLLDPKGFGRSLVVYKCSACI